MKMFGVKKVTLMSIGLVVCLGMLFSGCSSPTVDGGLSNSTTTTTVTTPTTPITPIVVSKNAVLGKVTILGAGTFTGGIDIPTGYYNVTTDKGAGGNFTVATRIDVILGNPAPGIDVTKIRVHILKGDAIGIQGLNKVYFQSVIPAIVTTVKPLVLTAGEWNVGQDICAGRYVVTPTVSTEAGNFIVYDSTNIPVVDEILGTPTPGVGVSKLTVNIPAGGNLNIGGLSSVTFTPVAN